MTNERYIHDELYIEVLPTTTAVVVRIFHAHVFDFTYEKPIAQAAIRIKQIKHQQSNNASNCVLNKKKHTQGERESRFRNIIKIQTKIMIILTLSMMVKEWNPKLNVKNDTNSTS